MKNSKLNEEYEKIAGEIEWATAWARAARAARPDLEGGYHDTQLEILEARRDALERAAEDARGGTAIRKLDEVKAALSGATYRTGNVAHQGNLLGYWPWGAPISLDAVFAIVEAEAKRGTLIVTLDDRWFVVKEGEVVYLHYPTAT